MLIDARELESGSVLETGVCVIGAGAAGIPLALELSRAGVDVCLLESGGQAYEAETQALYRGEITGRGYYALDAARLRWLGGTTNHWSGHSPALEPEAFERREWIAPLGWPFGRDHLDPYYRRAAPWIQLGDMPPDPHPDSEDPELQSFDFRADGDPTLETVWMRFSPPTRMGRSFGKDLEADERVRLLLHANVTSIARDPHQARIDHVEVKTLSGVSLQVKGTITVLAAGGIENPRLLLVSNDVEPAGLGNAHDHVGRYFMEHVQARDAGRWHLGGGRHATQLYAWPEGGLRGKAMAVLALTRDATERERIGSVTARLNWSSEARESEGWATLRQLRKESEWPDPLWPELKKILADADDVAVAAWEEIFGLGSGGYASLGCEFEQRPDPANRVTLTHERDALGLQRAHLHWVISDDDFHSLDRARRLIGREVGRAGLGRVQIDEGDEWKQTAVGAFHHMGTTRMAESPTAGVVDPDCRVHGISNFYIAGSSVFPTAGAANPTFTIVALAMRLADHLAAQLDAPGAS